MLMWAIKYLMSVVPFGAGTAFEGQIVLRVGIGVWPRQPLDYSFFRLPLILSLQSLGERRKV